MSFIPRYVPLSQPQPVTLGTTVPLPLSLQKGLRHSDAFPYAHVTKLLVVVRGITTGVAATDTALDAVACARLISEIQLNAGPDSPLGTREGGALIKNMSGYLALTALAHMSGAEVIEGTGAVWQQQKGTPFANESANSSGAPFWRKVKGGKLVHQGPYALVKAGSALANEELVYSLPIGMRNGEKDSLNPIPLSYLNGGGSPSGCGCAMAGTLRVKFGNAGGTLLGSLVVSAIAEVQVYAEVLHMDTFNGAPLQPYVTTYGNNNTMLDVPAVIPGIIAYCEDLSGGDVQLPNMTNVSYRQLKIGSDYVYDPTSLAARRAFLSSVGGNGCERERWADADPTLNDAWLLPDGATRYDTPYVPILAHPGASGSAPNMGARGPEAGTFELVGQGITSTTRNVLIGAWFPASNESLAAAEKATGAPLAPNGDKGTSPTLALSVPSKTVLNPALAAKIALANKGPG